MRPNEIKILKINLKHKINQIFSHIEELKDEVKLESKQIKKENKKIPKENPFDFTDYLEKRKEENEIDLGLFLKLAEENKIIRNQTPVNTLIEDMENLKNGFFTNVYFSLDDEQEVDTNRFFKDSDQLTKFIDKILDKHDDHPSICYTGNTYRSFKNFKRGNRSDHGGGANEFNNFLEHEIENCYIPSGNGCFLKFIDYILQKDISTEYLEFIQSYKKRTNVMSRYRIPEFCERYKIDIGIYDTKSKRTHPRSVKRRDICVRIPKNHYCAIWKKNSRDSLFNGVDEIDKNFTFVENKKNEINLKQRIRYRLPKHETRHQLENVLVFNL